MLFFFAKIFLTLIKPKEKSNLEDLFHVYKEDQSLYEHFLVSLYLKSFFLRKEAPNLSFMIYEALNKELKEDFLAQEKNFVENFNEALDLFKKKKYKKSLSILKKLHFLKREDEQVALAMGLNLELINIGEAQSFYEYYLIVNPLSVLVLERMVNLFYEYKQEEKFLTYLKKLLVKGTKESRIELAHLLKSWGYDKVAQEELYSFK